MSKVMSFKAFTSSFRERAEILLQQVRDRNIVVLGDVMLDEFIWGDVTRISPEAPVPVVNIKRESIHLGGAANVLANITAIGASGNVIGVVGRDAAAEKLRESLRKDGAGQTDDMLIADNKRPTTIKTRIIAHNQMVVRADREHRGAINGNVESQIIEATKRAIADADAHALIVSDYDKGVITPRILSEVLPLAYDKMPVLIDPKMRNFDSYRPATLLTPNHYEALRVTNLAEDSDETLTSAARSILKRLTWDGVVITRGEHGMILLEGENDPVFVKTAAREVFDVTGAGDTVIATLAVALAGGASMTEAAVFA